MDSMRVINAADSAMALVSPPGRFAFEDQFRSEVREAVIREPQNAALHVERFIGSLARADKSIYGSPAFRELSDATRAYRALVASPEEHQFQARLLGPDIPVIEQGIRGAEAGVAPEAITQAEAEQQIPQRGAERAQMLGLRTRFAEAQRAVTRAPETFEGPPEPIRELFGDTSLAQDINVPLRRTLVGSEALASERFESGGLVRGLNERLEKQLGDFLAEDERADPEQHPDGRMTDVYRHMGGNGDEMERALAQNKAQGGENPSFFWEMLRYLLYALAMGPQAALQMIMGERQARQKAEGGEGRKPMTEYEARRIDLEERRLGDPLREEETQARIERLRRPQDTGTQERFDIRRREREAETSTTEARLRRQPLLSELETIQRLGPLQTADDRNRAAAIQIELSKLDRIIAEGKMGGFRR